MLALIPPDWWLSCKRVPCHENLSLSKIPKEGGGILKQLYVLENVGIIASTCEDSLLTRLLLCCLQFLFDDLFNFALFYTLVQEGPEYEMHCTVLDNKTWVSACYKRDCLKSFDVFLHFTFSTAKSRTLFNTSRITLI